LPRASRSRLSSPSRWPPETPMPRETMSRLAFEQPASVPLCLKLCPPEISNRSVPRRS
jgi:hypothetical protein